jgi:aminoglycoside phosphotransferase (APT) family kinase protein
MNDKINDIEQLSAIVGARVVTAEPCGWGFENRTAIVTLEDGRLLVVQRINSRALAGHKLHLARVLPERLAAAGLRAPRLLAADAAAHPPYAVREYLPGAPGASLMGTIAGAIVVARAMGALLPRLALVDISGAGLNDVWARPASLTHVAQQQLDRCRSLLDVPTSAALEATIAEVAARLAGRPAGFAHGDFCPVNVLVETGDWGLGTGDWGLGTSDARLAANPQSLIANPQFPTARILGLLDLEFARVADPLFDAAWWGWVVRYHHRARLFHAWAQLLASAGIADDAETDACIRVIQRLRCLEMIDYCATTRTRDVAAMWVERLGTTLGWA